MLRNNVSAAARPIVANLLRRGIALESLDDTPLESAVDASQPLVNEELVAVIAEAGDDTTGAVLNAIEETSVISGSHAMIIDGLVEQGSALMVKTIDKARNVVAPAIATVASAIVENVDRALTPGNDVVVFKIHPLAASQTVSSLISQYLDASTDLTFIPDLPLLTGADYTALLETGNADTNALVVDYLAQYPDGYLDEVVNDLIRGSLSHGEAVSNGYARLVQFSGAKGFVRRSLAALGPLSLAAIVLNNLYDNPPQGVSVSIDYWNEQISITQAGLAANFHMLLSDIAQHIASGRLELPSTLRQGDVVPNLGFPILDRVYDAFLEAEGYPELLFALTLDGIQPEGTAATVLANQAELSAAWNTYVDNFRNAAMANLSATARDIAYGEIGKLIGTLDLSELGSDPSVLWEGVKEYAEQAEFTPDSMYEHVRYLVAGLLYARYQTLDLLIATDAYMAANPDCNPRVAAYHGAKAYICAWACSQMKRS